LIHLPNLDQFLLMPIPITEYAQDLLDMHESIYMRFFRHYIMSADAAHEEHSVQEMNWNIVYREFSSFCHMNGMRDDKIPSKPACTLNISKLVCMRNFFSVRRTSKGNVRSINMVLAQKYFKSN
jgi:hypothetical protein